MTTPTDAEARAFFHAGKVDLVAHVSETDYHEVCESGYVVEISRRDGEPISEIELRAILINTALAFEGKPSLIDLCRS